MAMYVPDLDKREQPYASPLPKLVGLKPRRSTAALILLYFLMFKQATLL